MSVGPQRLGGAGNLSRMNGQLGLDLGFLFCFSHHREVVGVDGRKGVGVLGHFPLPTPVQLNIPAGPLTSLFPFKSSCL